jgi:hypothetical protein
VGVDISDYIHATKDTSDADEIRQDIIDAGLDPDSGRGLEILNAVATPGPRASATILNVDITRRNEQKQISDALGGIPTHIVFEEIIDTDTLVAEIEDLHTGARQMSNNVEIIWLTAPPDHITWEELLAATQGGRLIDHRAVPRPEQY